MESMHLRQHQRYSRKLWNPIDAETNAQVLEIIKQQDEANAAKAATKPVPKKAAKKKAEPKKKSVKKATPKEGTSDG